MPNPQDLMNDGLNQAKGHANDALNKNSGGMGQKAQDVYHEGQKMMQGGGGDKKGAMNMLKDGLGKIMGGGK